MHCDIRIGRHEIVCTVRLVDYRTINRHLRVLSGDRLVTARVIMMSVRAQYCRQ